MLSVSYLSADSLLASGALSMLGVPPARRLKLCGALALSDALFTYLGLSLRGVWPGARLVELGPYVPAAYLLLVIALALRARRSAVGAGVCAAVPVLLGLDNLLAGLAGSPAQGGAVGAALAAGIGSGVMALCGLALAALLSRRMAPGWAYASGLLLLAAPLALR
jgi:hypothetical protein